MSGQGAGSILKDENDPDNSFDIFTFPQKDVCMEKRETQEILSEIPVTDEGPYDYRISSQNKEYLYMPQTRLEGCLEIEREDGEEFEAEDDFSVCNMFPNSIFKQVECKLMGKFTAKFQYIDSFK